MDEYTEETIVCFCSKISVREVSEAVGNGSNTINDVRNYLNKHITGNCKETSPDGKCCHAKFSKLINKLKK